MNAKSDFQYTDQTLNEHIKENTILSILNQQDGFLFYIYQPKNSQLLHIEQKLFSPSSLLYEYHAFLDEIINRSISSGFRLTEIRILQPSQKVTIVPSAVFEHDKVHKIYHLNFEDDKRQNIHHYTFKPYDIIILYPVPAQLMYKMPDYQVPVKYYNQVIPLFRYINLQKEDKGLQLYIHLSEDFADFILIKDLKLKFFNSFMYKNETDFIYYTLNLIKQLDIERKELHVNLFGLHSKSDKRISQLHHFIDKMYFVKDNSLKYNFSMESAQIYENLNFLNLHLCE